MFGRIALAACLGWLPLAASAQFFSPGIPAGGAFPNPGLNSFQNPFTTLPTGNAANPFPGQFPTPYGQQFFGFPRQGTGTAPYPQPQLNGQPMSGLSNLPFAQPTPYWMQTPSAQNYMPQAQTGLPPAIPALPAAAPQNNPQSPPTTYYQYAPSAAPTDQPPRWAPRNGTLPRSTGNPTGNPWSMNLQAQPEFQPASPPRWPTP